MNKTHYSYICNKCFENIGKPLDYEYKRYEATYFCVANDRTGDDDYDNDYVLCSICGGETYDYYQRAYPENVLFIDSLEEYETILKEANNTVIIYFVKGSKFSCSDLTGYGNNSYTFLLVDLEREKGQEIAKKESVNEICYLIYLNGKRFKVIKCDIRLFKKLIEEKKTFTSKHHDHELKYLQLEGEVKCNICKELVEKHEDEVYYCFQCEFILCNYCKGEEEGKTDIKREYVFEPLKNIDEYNEIIKNNKKVVVLFYSRYDDFRKEFNFIKKLKNEYPEIKFYKIYMFESITIVQIKVRSSRCYINVNGKMVLEPKEYEKEERPEAAHLYFFEEGKSKYDIYIYHFNALNRTLTEFCGRDYEKIESKRHKHPLSKVKMIRFYCYVCEKGFTDENEPLFKTVYKCIGCEDSNFELCEECRKKELEENK